MLDVEKISKLCDTYRVLRCMYFDFCPLGLALTKKAKAIKKCYKRLEKEFFNAIEQDAYPVGQNFIDDIMACDLQSFKEIFRK